MEELDRASVANRERFSRFAGLRRYVRGERGPGRRTSAQAERPAAKAGH
jgi:hypothetical protein